MRNNKLISFSAIIFLILFSFLTACEENQLDYVGNHVVDYFVEECAFDCEQGTCTSIPIVDDISDITVNENEQIIVSVNATDYEGDVLTYSANIIHLIQKNDSNGSDNIFIWNTTYDDAGIYKAIVSVSDGFNMVKKQFNIIINNVNRAPVIPSSQEFNPVQGKFFSSQINVTDPDGDALTYELVPAKFMLNRFTGDMTINPNNADVGTHYLTVKVSDLVETVSGALVINIANVNDEPAIDFIVPMITKVNSTFTYQVIATDPDNDSLFYSDNTTLFDIKPDGLINFTPAP